MTLEITQLDAGFVRHKKTRRYHAILKYGDERLISKESFETPEQAIDYVKQWADEIGGDYTPVQ